MAARKKLKPCKIKFFSQTWNDTNPDERHILEQAVNVWLRSGVDVVDIKHTHIHFEFGNRMPAQTHTVMVVYR